jgi:uncharacterized protein YggE
MESQIQTTNTSQGNHTVHTINPSDRVYKIMLTVIAIAGVFLLGELLYQFKSLPQNMPREISVSGEGKAYIKPDIALVTLGATTQELKSQDAVNKNNEIINKTIKELKDLGIDEKDIQTTMYQLTPIYDYETIYSPSPMAPAIYPVPPSRNGRVFKGYSLQQQISVKIRNFDLINSVLDKATASGATNVGELQFTVDNPEKVRSEARAKAIEAAKQKMKDLARESGLRIGKLVNVYEGYSGYPQPMYGMGGASMEKAVDAVAPQIQPGQMEINTTVNLVYQVR